MEHSRARRIGYLWIVLAFLARFSAAAPVISNFRTTDCEGNLQSSLTTSTGTPTVQVQVRDVSSGLRIGRAEHIGGTSARTGTVLLLHFDESTVPEASAGPFIDSTTINNTVDNSGTADGGAGSGFTGLAGDRARNFNTAGDFIRVLSTGPLNNTTEQLTIQAWVNPTDVTSDPVFEWNNGTTPGVHLWLGNGGVGNLYANLVDTDSVNHALNSPAGIVATGQWQMVTLTYAGETARLYLNDVQVASQSFSGSIGFLRTSYNAFIGRRPGGATFNGSIDEVRVLNERLSIDDIRHDYYAGRVNYSTPSASATIPLKLPGGAYTAGTTTGTLSITVASVTVALGAGSNSFIFGFQNMSGDRSELFSSLLVETRAPDPPGSFAGTPQAADQILWTWAKPARICLSAALGPPDYVLRYSSAAAPSLSTVTAPTLQYLETGLSTNAAHGRRMFALDAYGSSTLTSHVTAYTLAAAATEFFPAASVSTGSMVVSWTLNGNPSYTRWEVSVSSVAGFAAGVSTPVAISDDMTGNSAGIGGLLPSTTYHIRVRPANGRSSDSFGGVFSAFLSTSIATLPSATAVTGVGASPTSILWSWTSVPSATGYTLVSSTGGVLFGGNALSFTSTGLSTNTLNSARVFAHNLSGSSVGSAFASVYTQAAPPTGTSVPAVSSLTVSLAWNANTNPAGTVYEVFIATSSGFTGTVSTQSASTTSFLVTGLLPETSYFLRVRSLNGDSIPSAYDASVSTRTNPITSITGAFTPPTPYVPASGTVGLWHYDEASGTTTLDSSGFSNHGGLGCLFSSCTSTPTYAAGQTGLGTALRFPGIVGSRGRVPDSPTLQFAGSLTVEAWVNPANAAQVSGAGVVAKGAANQAGAWALDVSGGRWRFVVNDSGAVARSVSSTNTITAGRWTHLVGVWDEGGTSTISLYVDGALSASLNVGAVARGANADEMSFGNRRTLGGGSYDLPFSGDVDEVHLLARAIPAAEAASDWASGRPGVVTLPAPNDGTRVTLPPDALRAPGLILVSSSPLTQPVLISRQTLLDGLASPPTGHTLVPGSVVEVIANVGGFPFTADFGSPVTLSLSYPDAERNGLVDGTSPPLPASGLVMYTLDPVVVRWVPLPSSVDQTNRRVLGQTTHFSIFALFGPTGIQSNASGARVYPVPWRPGSGTRFDSVAFNGRTGLAFDNLPAAGSIRIFTLAGEMVVELPFAAANVGTLIWDGRNHAGRPVASGVYFAYVKGSGEDHVVLKFAIER